MLREGPGALHHHQPEDLRQVRLDQGPGALYHQPEDLRQVRLEKGPGALYHHRPEDLRQVRLEQGPGGLGLCIIINQKIFVR